MRALPFQDHPDSAETRRIVLAELARLEALFVERVASDGDRRFDWWGTTHWIDRERWLVTRHEAPSDDERSVYGGEARALHVIDVIDVFAQLVSGTFAKHSWWPPATTLLNLVVVQPLVNPAIAPLFWPILNWEMAPDARGELMDVMRPMLFDMTAYPASRRAAPAVRAAQADFFREHDPALLPADWATLDDEAWAAACTQLVETAKYGIESHVFDVVTDRARAIRLGLRPG